ncbi:family 78 glycoside hydrolase catalytic domain [Streptomyces sp. NL15-2K]|uniref:family 78 glycoside hydrolase catalytic domain n=1 Tax=Streptomyces sp. NL15-2K TaxID=376149 RepID=UPI000F583CE2|nr:MULTISPECIES: family 78 glycoside hydrolase catalytic domain [Actinomycetes]WKX15819.1 family 78 glycoside hydrolase catalytic domain [Kutzneria buriramensis]GCB42788.1 alfa-L-rhamnosidase [Streptomyces sp. NL15-2K]
MNNAPYDLRIDSGGDQFTVSGPAPRLSWKPPSDAGFPASYELECTVDGEAQPAVRAASGRHRFLPWPWAALRSGRQVAWRVRADGTGSPSPWSEWNAFEVGLLDEDWQARWISPLESGDRGYGKRPAHTLSTRFEARAGVRSARLYATALGVYEAYVNGERAGTAELSPGSTSYDRTLHAQASDVTAAVRAGGNLIEIILSDGWYRGQVGAFRLPAGWGTNLGARAELHIAYEDGSRQVVRSDETWTCTRSAITRADLMDGQTTDFHTGPGAEQPVLVDQVEAPAIDWSPAPPVRVVESRPAQSVKQLEEGLWIADFGQNASGWITLSGLGPAGTRTVIDYGEHVGADGDLTTAHLDSTRPGEDPIPFVQRDEVVSAGQGGVFEPRHTVHGFRYARIRRDGAPLDPASITMRVVHTDLRRTGSFACSDDDLNRLHEIADWSFRGNAVDVPTDCPTRERLAWTGDYQVFAPTATRLYDVLGFSRKWLRSVRDDQLPDGRIANFSPDGRRIKHHLDDQFAMMTGSAGWGDAVVAVPWELYQSYGDREILTENWEAMVRWVEWALQTARTTRHQSRIERSPEPLPHEHYLWDGSFHWGEWTEPKAKAADGTRIDPIKDDPVAWFMADKGEVGTAFLYRSTSTLADVARVLGRTEHEARYTETAERIRDAWRTEFLTPDGRTTDDTQAAYVRALSLGLVPEELRSAAAARLVELIRAAGTHLGTGFLATGDLLPVLADTGHADIAYELLLRRTAPSWLYMLDRGATTIWEGWEGIDENGDAHDSLNHYSKGAVIRFLHTHTLGLRQTPESVAWESFVVAPVPHPSLTWARGTHESPQGTITVEWRTTDDELTLTVEVPPTTTARVVFPDGTTETATTGTFRATRRMKPGS